MTSIATPLVWRTNHKWNNVREAQGYDVQQNGNGSWTVKPIGNNRVLVDRFEKDFDSLEQAQDACQNHADECALLRLSPEARAWMAEGVRAQLDVRDPDFARIEALLQAIK